MSKRELTTKNVVKAITLGLAAALATMTPMTDINAVVAFADDETNENQQDASTKDAADYAREAEDAFNKVDVNEGANEDTFVSDAVGQAEIAESNYDDTKEDCAEAKKISEEAAQSLEDAKNSPDDMATEGGRSQLTDGILANVTAALEAVDNAVSHAENATTAAENAVGYAEKAKAATQNAADAGLAEADVIENDIEEIKADVSAENDKLSVAKKAFNDDVAADQKNVESKVSETIGETDGKTDIIVKIESGESSIEVNGAEYVAEQAKAARQALESVKDGMETALTYTSRDEVKLQDNEEVALGDVLMDIADAVADASTAYNQAIEIRDSEIDQYNKLVKEFNALIEEYGLDKLTDERAVAKLPYYGKDEVDPKEVFYKGITKEVEAKNIDALVEVIKDFKSADIDTAKQNLANIETAVNKADTAQKNAVDVAKKAIESAQGACGKAREAVQYAKDTISYYENAKNVHLDGNEIVPEDKHKDNGNYTGNSTESPEKAIENAYLQALNKWYKNVQKLENGRYSVEEKKSGKSLEVFVSGLTVDDVQFQRGNGNKKDSYSVSVHGYKLILSTTTVVTDAGPEYSDETTRTEIATLMGDVPDAPEYSGKTDISALVPIMGEEDTFAAEFADKKATIAGLENDIIVIKDGATGVDLDAAQTAVSGMLRNLLTSMVNAKTVIDDSNQNVLMAKKVLDEATTLNDFAQLLNKDNMARLFIETQKQNNELWQVGDKQVGVPYGIIREYVKEMTDENSQLLDTDYVDISGENTRYFWLVGPNGQPTGEVFTEDTLPKTIGSYTFFVGNQISKGFKINGKIYSYSILNPGDPIIFHDGEYNFIREDQISNILPEANQRVTAPVGEYIMPEVLGAARTRTQGTNPSLSPVDAVEEDAHTEVAYEASTQPIVSEVTFPEDMEYRYVVDIPETKTPLAGELPLDDEPDTDNFWTIMILAIFGSIGAAAVKAFTKKKAEATKKKPVERTR